MRFSSFLTIVSIALVTTARADSDGDGGVFWFGLDAETEINPRLEFELDATLRASGGFERLARVGVEAALKWKPVKWLRLAPSLTYNHDKPSADEERDEVRPALDITLEYETGLWEFSLGNAFEYRFLSDRASGARWRPRLAVERQLGPKELGLKACIANELFFDFRDAAFTKNRLFIGMEKKLSERWSAEIFYSRQHGLGGHSSDENILGLSFHLTWNPFARR